MRRSIVCMVVVVSFTLSLLGSALAQAPIKIGALYPLSGRPALFGKDSVAAAEIAVEEVNQAGGVLGRKFELLVTDSRANPQESIKIAERYIMQDKVNFLYGIVSSAVALAITEVSKKHKKILIVTDASSTQLTMEKWQPYFFRVSIDSYQAQRTTAMLAQYKPWKKYYVVGADYEGPHSLWDNFWISLKKLRPDVTLIGEGWPKLGEPDYQSYITAAMAAKPDVLFMALWGGDATAFLKQAKQYNLFSKMDFLATEIGGDYGVFEALGEVLPDGLMMSSRYHPYFPKTDANKKFVEKFHQKTGRYPGYVADGAYTGIKVLAKAIEKAKTADDSDKLIKALEGLEIVSLSNPEGVVSKINPLTHQLSFWHAIGFTMKSDEYPPAKTILGNFFCVPTPDPTKEEIMKARAKK
jgi:branched-chain amino acid transport system substrate-binding protein